MIYSVRDADLGRFRYYAAPDFAPAVVPKTHALLGTAADDATPALPLLARELGTGDEAIGRIAKPGLNLKQIGRWVVIGLAIYGALVLLD